MDALFVYIAAKDASQAHDIGRALVEEHLAACVNIIAAMESIYRWEGAICEDSEAVIVVKTRQPLLESLIKRVKELHTYSCPCIVALPIVGGNSDYLEWIRRETSR